MFAALAHNEVALVSAVNCFRRVTLLTALELFGFQGHLYAGQERGNCESEESSICYDEEKGTGLKSNPRLSRKLGYQRRRNDKDKHEDGGRLG